MTEGEGVKNKRKSLLEAAFRRFPPAILEFTFANLFIWGHCYRRRIRRFKSVLRLVADNEQNAFFFPTMGEGNVVKCCLTLLPYLQIW